MPRIIKLFLLLMMSGLSLLLFPQNNQPSKKETGKTKGFEVIFVVDVSSADKEYGSLVENFINAAYDAFHGSFKRNDKNNYHLITLANRAKLIKNSKMDKNFILKEIKSQFGKQRPIYLKQGLSQVLDLVANGFSRKVGVVLFISNGNDRRINWDSAREDVKRTIHALKNLGINVFSIYLSAGPMRCKECMLMISEWSKKHFSEIEKKGDIQRNVEAIVKEALDLDFSSPVERKAFNESEKNWQNTTNQLRDQRDRAEKENKQKEMQLKQWENLFMNEQKRVESLGKSNEELNSEIKNNNRQIMILWLIVTALLIILTILLKDKLPFLHSRKDLLWGKLKPISGKNSAGLVDLSCRKKGTVIKTPNKEVPDFKLYPCSCFGRRVMCVQVEDGYVHYLKKGVLHKSNHCMDGETNRIKIYPLSGENPFEYEYYFLNKLKESCKKPVWGKSQFVAPTDILNQIKENFLSKKNICSDIIISGMGNSGKTSLLKYLNEKYFKDDWSLERKCTWSLFEYDTGIGNNVKYFEMEFQSKVEKLIKSKTKRKILFIDDYDELFLRFGDDFRNLIINSQNTINDLYFVLAGRRPGDLVLKKNKEIFLPKYNEIILKGIYKPHSFFYSTRIIDLVFKDIGFRSIKLSEEIKNEIAFHASGMPYFCKRILIELLEKWMNFFKKDSFDKKDIEEAALKIAENEREIYLENIITDFDANDSNKRNKVLFQDILNRISESDGRIKINELESVSSDTNSKIGSERKDSFIEKLDHLIALGMVVVEDEFFVGIPHLFYHRKEEDK